MSTVVKRSRVQEWQNVKRIIHTDKSTQMCIFQKDTLTGREVCILLFIYGFHTVVLAHVARKPRSDA